MNMIIGALSIGGISTVINSISTLSLNIYSLTNNIKLSKNIYHQDIKDVLMKTDLDATINLLQSIIIEIPNYFNDNMSVIIALKNMQEIIGQIEAELKIINNKMEYNKSIYLMKNYRSYDFKSELKKLETYIFVLEKRRDNLFKTLEVFKCSKKNKEPNHKLLTIAQIEESIYEIDEDSIIL